MKIKKKNPIFHTYEKVWIEWILCMDNTKKYTHIQEYINVYDDT